MKSSQQRYHHTSLELYHVACIATNRRKKKEKRKKTENKLHVRDSINFNILSINKWSKKKMENMHKKGAVGGEKKWVRNNNKNLYLYIV